MSLEAQFYEARRRQNIIDRRQSLRTAYEIAKQNKKSEYQPLFIPVRFVHQDERCTCTCIPTNRIKSVNYGQSLYQRDRDIYPRPLPITTKIRRPTRHAKLHNRFSSVDYLQQW